MRKLVIEAVEQMNSGVLQQVIDSWKGIHPSKILFNLPVSSQKSTK